MGAPARAVARAPGSILNPHAPACVGHPRVPSPGKTRVLARSASTTVAAAQTGMSSGTRRALLTLVAVLLLLPAARAAELSDEKILRDFDVVAFRNEMYRLPEPR